MTTSNSNAFEQITLLDLYAMVAWHALLLNECPPHKNHKTAEVLARGAYHHAFFMLCERKAFSKKKNSSVRCRAK